MLEFTEELRALAQAFQNACSEKAVPLPNEDKYYCLSRPNLYFSLSSDKSKIDRIKIDYLEKPVLILRLQPSLALLTFHETANGGDNRLLNLDDSNIRTTGLNANDYEVFAHAKEVLSRSIECVHKDEPLEKNISWPQALRMHIEKEDPLRFDTWFWGHCVNTWATSEMKEVVNIASSLVDPSENVQGWKILIATSWKNLEIQSIPVPSFKLNEYESAY